jgi:hypothetical protein
MHTFSFSFLFSASINSASFDVRIQFASGEKKVVDVLNVLRLDELISTIDVLINYVYVEQGCQIR